MGRPFVGVQDTADRPMLRRIRGGHRTTLAFRMGNGTTH